MGVVELDTLRADAMRAMLNEEGRRQVWRYDVGRLESAYRAACYDQDYDNIKTDGEAMRAGVPYVLTGPGICDAPFTTPAELLMLVHWLCTDGYLSCYQRERWQWHPHLAADQDAIAALWNEA